MKKIIAVFLILIVFILLVVGLTQLIVYIDKIFPHLFGWIGAIIIALLGIGTGYVVIYAILQDIEWFKKL